MTWHPVSSPLWGAILGVLLLVAAAEAARFCVDAPGAVRRPVLQAAETELQQWLEAAGATDADDADWQIVLERDDRLQPYQFAVEVSRANRGGSIRLTGATDTEVLHAVYALLEELGYLFEITGPVPPVRLDWAALRPGRCVTTPAVQQRGIYFIMNFPMDLSGYPLDEAREYIRNIARLRFNLVVFHSYPGQWTPADLPARRIPAGGFFYGQRHDIPQEPFFRQHIRNERVFCIPEIEPVFDEPVEREAAAVDWMRAVMRECRRLGLRVHLLLEPRSTSTDVSETLMICRQAYQTYPLIDRLILNTQEVGGWGDVPPPQRLREIITEHFGAALLTRPAVARLLEGRRPRLDVALGELGHNCRAVTALKQEWQPGVHPEPMVGLYLTVSDSFAGAVDLMRQVLPPTVRWSVMPGHGNKRTLEHVLESGFDGDAWRRSLMCNWLEMDGLMYLQQNSLMPIYRLFQYAEGQLAGEPIPAMCFLQWRLAECRTLARYAAGTCLRGTLLPTRFYHEYGRRLGIVDVDAYARAMALLDYTDARGIDVGPSLGFSFVGCWGAGLGLYGSWRRSDLRSIRADYEAVRALLAPCAVGLEREAAREYLAFLDNRLRFTVVYLAAQERGCALQDVVGQRAADDLSPAERAEVVRICDDALAQLRQAMELHAEMMPDRGCEGNLISFYHTPVAVLKRIRQEYGQVGAGVAVQAELPDAPPPPIVSGP